MEILSYVKDLLLDYANKKALLKNNGDSKANQEALDNNLVANMMVLRDRFPEYLFINYDKNITEDDAREVFKKIKENVSKHHSLSYILCPHFFPVNIGGSKFEIPGYCTLTRTINNDYFGAFVIDYDSEGNKKMSFNQTLVHLLISFPIKKIQLNIVDLKGSFEYDIFLRNLPSALYHGEPITTESLLAGMLDRLEKRKIEVIKSYGNISDYCAKHRNMPIPYEFVIIYDEQIDEKYHKRLNSIIDFSSRIGVYFIFARKASRMISDINEPYVLSKNGKEVYTHRIPQSLRNECNLKYTGLNYFCKNKSADFIFQLYNLFDDKYIVPGEGDYEVILEKNEESFVPIPKELINAPSVISRFTTMEQACIFQNNFLNGFKILKPSILVDYKCDYLGGERVVFPILIVEENLMWYQDDILFYLSFIYNERARGNLLKKGSRRSYNNGNPSIVFDSIQDTYEAIFYKEIDAFLRHVNYYAKEKWGNDYMFEHLYLRKRTNSRYYDAPFNLVVKKTDYLTVPLEHYEAPKNDGIINFTPITGNETLLKACFDYIRTEAEAKEEMKVQTLDFASAAENKYETDLSTMIIPVGKAEAKDADFRMDLVSHVHSFIIGQSGSGKSVFLHNIIGGAMLKYAPEDLQLYLLDFKLGGVEFNRYQGAKHVKALLVDNSDPQVTLEILRELRNSMTERGKLLRGAGVNNIGEYNKLHQQDRMPHVLVVADECHEMFKDDDSIPRKVRNEISDIVIKIAKEGRSQGVHLVFATQTLSGTEISSEIINNVSDFYLLKCAQTDSERLVSNSSTITSELSTGQIYYHHVDEQVKFQAYYTDKEASEKLMAAIVEKAKDHKSNGEFYFNGAQMFYLDEAVKEQIQNVKGKSPVAFLGKAIDISQKDLCIRLNEDFSENVLLLGLNDQEQVTRTTMNLFVSLMMSAKLKHKDIAFKVIDCLNNEEGDVHELIFDLENEGLCEIVERRQRSKFFKDLAQGVLDGTAEETILLILGQDRFRELKMNLELEDDSLNSSDNDAMSISDKLFGGGGSSSSSVRTYKDALNVILEKGPDYGVHTLLQLEKATNFLFEDILSTKELYQRFKHLILLRSDEMTSSRLSLNDDIHLEKLSSDWERLRAYYYAEESDSYTLFTPYMPSKSKEIINLLKTI